MKVLFIGDIVGKPGRDSVRQRLDRLRMAHEIDFVIANGENAAGGLGITEAVAGELFASGIQAMTLGNHVWRKKEFVQAIDGLDRVIRPANYPPGAPGVGATLIEWGGQPLVGVVNLLGRVFMEPLDCPFAAGHREVSRLREQTPVIIVDMHAEATSEKIAMGAHLDGLCSAVIGTHTHVQTADERILPRGTAYITDVGMTGPLDSVIGTETERALRKFTTGMPSEFRVAKGPAIFNAVIIDINEGTGRARDITRIALADKA